MVRREELEATFVAHLRRLQPDEQTIAEFPQIAEKVWTQKQGDAEATAKKLRARLDEQKRMKSELLRAKLRGEVTQADYAQANAEFDNEIAALDEQLQSARSNRLSLDAFRDSRRSCSSMLQELGSEQVLSRRCVFKIFCSKAVCATRKN